MNPVVSTALSGLLASSARLNASASRTGATPDGDIVAERVEQITASDAFKANAAVLKTAFQMNRTLLDIKV